MLKNFYRIGVVLSVVALFTFGGCSKGKKPESSKATVKVYVAAVYEAMFPDKYSKYDDLLKKAHTINSSLEGAAYNIDNFAESMSHLVGEAKDFANDPKVALQAYLDYLKSQNVVIAVSVVASGDTVKFKVSIIEPDVVSDELRVNIDAFEQLIGSLPNAIDDLTTAVTTSVALAQKCKTLAESAKTDFVGLDARFAPKAAKALIDAATELTKTPAKAKELVDSVQNLVDTIKTTFGT